MPRLFVEESKVNPVNGQSVTNTLFSDRNEAMEYLLSHDANSSTLINYINRYFAHNGNQRLSTREIDAEIATWRERLRQREGSPSRTL